MLVALPNLPDPTAADEDDGRCARSARPAPTGARPPRARRRARSTWSAARALSGSRFAYLRATSSCSSWRSCAGRCEKLVGHGFEPVIPPVLVREEALYGTGFLPDTEQQIYHLPDDDLYLVGHLRGARWPRCTPARSSTADDAAAALRGLLVLLPARGGRRRARTRAASSACTSSTRSRCSRSSSPTTSRDEHERLLAIEEEILQELEIPYRVVNIAVGDLGASRGQEVRLRGVAARPGALPRADLDARTRPTTRRAACEIRYRPPEGARAELVHTLNGTAVTWRHMIALLENGQREDGSVELPEVLVALRGAG